MKMGRKSRTSEGWPDSRLREEQAEGVLPTAVSQRHSSNRFPFLWEMCHARETVRPQSNRSTKWKWIAGTRPLAKRPSRPSGKMNYQIIEVNCLYKLRLRPSSWARRKGPLVSSYFRFVRTSAWTFCLLCAFNGVILRVRIIEEVMAGKSFGQFEFVVFWDWITWFRIFRL